MVSLATGFIVATLLSAVCLWAGMKLTRVDGSFVALVVIAAVASLLGVIPFVGWLVALAAMLVLICKWTDAEHIWPDAILMVLVARLVSMAAGVLLAG